MFLRACRRAALTLVLAGLAALPSCGLRLDDSRTASETARPEPETRPSPSEQRAARALALAEADIINRGGAVMYRPDGSASQPHSVKFPAAPGELTLEYAASERLNRFEESPHALLLVIYHLSDRAALDQLSAHENGMRKLLAGEYFDDSVKSARRHFVQPGAAGTLRLDRPEDGRFVAVAAGYAEPNKRTSLFVAEYGVGQWTTGGESVIHHKKKMYSPLPMRLFADLGENDMVVTNTGRIPGDLQKVHLLMARQTRYVTREHFFPGLRAE